MTLEAAGAGINGRQLFEINDLVHIATRFRVLLARAMASFAPLPLRPAVLIERGLPVRTTVVSFGHVFVAGAASVGANVKRWVSGPINRRLGGVVLLLVRFPSFLAARLRL